MITKLTKKIFILLILFTVSSEAYAQEEQEQPQKEPTLSEFAAEKIIHIRNNPADYANSGGIDPGTMFENFPWMKDDTGLVNKTVASSEIPGEKHTELSVKKYITDNNSGFGFNSSSMQGAASGRINFKNYMTKKEALSAFIDMLFLKEVSSDYSKKRFILDCRFNLAKAQVESIEKDSYQSNEFMNSYDVTLSLASDETVSGSEAINIINFVRDNPLMSNDYILKYFPDARYDYSDYAAEYNQAGLTPFLGKSFINNKHDYQKTEKIYEYFRFLEPLSSVEKAVAVFIIRDLKDKESGTFVFSKFIEGLSFDFKKLPFNIGPDKSIAKYFLNGSSPEAEIKKQSPVTGLYIQVSKDKNNDFLYTPGEGVADMPVFVENSISGEKIKYFTDRTGSLQLWVEKNQTYIIGYEFEDQNYEKMVRTEENSRYVKIDL